MLVTGLLRLIALAKQIICWILINIILPVSNRLNLLIIKFFCKKSSVIRITTLLYILQTKVRAISSHLVSV